MKKIIIFLLSSFTLFNAYAFAGISIQENKSQYTVSVDGVPTFFFGSDAEYSTLSKAIAYKLDNPTKKVVYYLNYYSVEIKNSTPDLFSKTFWTTKKDPVLLPNSAALSAELLNQTTWGGGVWLNYYAYSTPVYFVDSSTPKVPVNLINYDGTPKYTSLYTEFQKGVPIPPNVRPADGNDSEVTIIDIDTKKLWDFFFFKKTGNVYTAVWGGVINNVETDGVMPIVNGERWGAAASGLPVAGGTILLKELQAGVIPHALSFAIPKCKMSFVIPATGTDGAADGIIPQGTKFQLPANVVINPAWSPMTKMLVIAARDYGMYLRDTSGAVSIYAEDTIRYNLNPDPYTAFFGGLYLWDVMRAFPWNQLQAVQF